MVKKSNSGSEPSDSTEVSMGLPN